eukprot:m.1373678 g.1373678  ORF g.1373678 m.1373678 type:complete len:304 (-) comp24956_c0_seq8:2290-3201(-)
MHDVKSSRSNDVVAAYNASSLPTVPVQGRCLPLLAVFAPDTDGAWFVAGGALTANQFSEETRLQILHMVKEGSLSPAQVAEAAFFADKGAPAAAASGKADDGTKNGPILMAGWLKKHAHKFGQNHTRWFELTNESGGKTMRYYTKPRGEEKGVIMLRDVKSIECTGMRLTLMNIHNNRAYRLDAEDAYTCRSWEKALKEPNGKKPQATAAGPVIPRYIAGESDESDGDGLYEEPSDNDAGPSRSAHTVHMYTGCPSMFVSFCWDDIVEFSLKSLITVACLVIFDFNFFLCMSVKVRDLIAQCF